MSRFFYVARDGMGIQREGDLEAHSLQEAAGIIREQGMYATKIEPARNKRDKWSPFYCGTSRRYAAFFCRQLSVMIDEQPLNEILSGLSRLGGEKQYRRLLEEMYQDVVLGKSLPEAMARHPDVFSHGVIQLIRAGQESGNLSLTLERLADFLERQQAARQKFGASMLYPAILGTISLLAASFLICFVLPSFATLFANLHADLPLPTKVLLSVGKFVSTHGIWLILPFAGLSVFGGWLYCRESLRWRVDYLLLRIPVLGKLKQDIAWMNVLWALALQLEGGIRLNEALRSLCDMPSNRFLRRLLKNMSRNVSLGHPMTYSLENCKVFPPLLGELIAAGEKSGRLEEMLKKCAEHCALSAENLSLRLQSLAEPGMILVIGGMVFTFALSIALPLLEAIDRIG